MTRPSPTWVPPATLSIGWHVRPILDFGCRSATVFSAESPLISYQSYGKFTQLSLDADKSTRLLIGWWDPVPFVPPCFPSPSHFSPPKWKRQRAQTRNLRC